MPQRTCGTSGCPNAHRAKGLCSSCYNRQHQPDRHRKNTTPCTVCGEPALKASSKRYRPVCSMYCRWFLQNPVLSCPLPASHPAHPDHAAYVTAQDLVAEQRATQADLARAKREEAKRERLAQVAALMQHRPCDDCGLTYTPGTTVQRYCSARCLRRVMRRERKAKEHGAQGSYTWAQVIGLFLLFDRRCAYCAELITGQPDPDHVVPLSRGGHNGISNILPACRACNGDKRDVLIEDWNEDRERRGLPLRLTSWDPLDPRYVHLAPTLAYAP